MSTEVINAVFSGLVLLLGALAGAANVRARRVAVDRRAYRALQRQNVVALGHIYALELALASRGITPPPRPEALEDFEDDDLDTPPPPTLPPPPVPA